jgi:hypothetical protein
MRYFNATEVTRPEADYIRQTTDESLSNTVVISLSSRWYDVRRLTDKELRDFVEQLLREELELVRAGGQIPH